MDSYDVFISYSSKEFDSANIVRTVLNENNLSCWMAPESIPGGSNYTKEIPVAIKHCNVFVLILSENAQHSIWVSKEVQMALNYGKTVVPFVIENCYITEQFSFILNESQRIEAYEKTSEALENIVNTIKSIINLKTNKKNHNQNSKSDTSDQLSNINTNSPIKPLSFSELTIDNVKIGDTIIFGKYQQKNISSISKDYVEWVILDIRDTEILVISRFCLDSKPYHTGLFAAHWNNCSLRKWLNTTFLNDTFTKNEQNNILETQIRNEINPQYKTKAGKDTKDKLFLLSISEAKLYFTNDQSRKSKATTYASEQGAYINESLDSSWWWLRTPGSKRGLISSIGTAGDISYDGRKIKNLGNTIRPAMWISIKK